MAVVMTRDALVEWTKDAGYEDADHDTVYRLADGTSVAYDRSDDTAEFGQPRTVWVVDRTDEIEYDGGYLYYVSHKITGMEAYEIIGEIEDMDADEIAECITNYNEETNSIREIEQDMAAEEQAEEQTAAPTYEYEVIEALDSKWRVATAARKALKDALNDLDTELDRATADHGGVNTLKIAAGDMGGQGLGMSIYRARNATELIDRHLTNVSEAMDTMTVNFGDDE
jgi:hypothetical protein